MRNSTRNYISAVLLMAGAVAYVSWVRYNDSHLQDNKPNKLPRIDATDIHGQVIQNEKYRGRPIYIQFIKDNSRTGIRLLTDLLVEWEDSSLSFLVITNKPDELYDNVARSPRLSIIGSDHYERLKVAFHAPETGSYFLYDSSGSLIITGRDYVDAVKDLKRHLNYVLKGKVFTIQEFIPSNLGADGSKGLMQLHKLVEAAPGPYIVIALFTSICSGCRSGEIMQHLQKLDETKDNLISITCILGADLSEIDSVNAKSQLRLPFPLIVASYDLRLRWDSLITEYSESELTDIVIILDKQGDVLDVAHPNCQDCWNAFYARLDKLGTEKIYDKND